MQHSELQRINSFLTAFARRQAARIVELGSRSITVNAVAPGFTPMDMTKGFTQKRQDEIVADSPLHRGGDRNEVASAVQRLASPGGGFVTGAVIPVDGGLSMGH
ncbi:SDR family oxidoreductase [Streptomyces sp. NBC_01727]|uniref:SDR family oxidoreductase n=1 Tax=Streptomyces sp. NBC_01727 TaxID=2975924 RepID=UPI002E0F8F45|nr:SDR family oxidoreductase [Streptomyces sp. NBC_01727]